MTHPPRRRPPWLTVLLVVASIGFVAQVMRLALQKTLDRPQPGRQTHGRFVADLAATRCPIDYLVYLPDEYGKRERTWPLLLFLHGTAQRGDDLNLVREVGVPKRIEDGARFPFIVLSPQCPTERSWEPGQLLALLDHAQEEFAVDPDRVYVTGFELGGYGTWYLAASAPERFAAIVPISGFPKNEDRERLDWLKSMGIWAFHGTNEQTAKLSVVREMIERHWSEGGSARLTVYPEKHHESWSGPYLNPELYEWMGRQARRTALKTQWAKGPPVAGEQVAGRFVAPYGLETNYRIYLPAQYDPAAARTWPLIVFLHDTGRNASEVEFDTHTGIPRLIDEGAQFPFIVLSPECRRGESWEPSALFTLLDHVQAQFRVDPHRVTLTGIGAGGDATWKVATVEPDRFAAIVPVESIPTGVYRSQVHYLRDVSIWAFHSDDTEAGKFSYVATVNDFLRDKGKAARLTLCDTTPGDVGDEPYKNPALYRWLETQKREVRRPHTSEWEGDLRNVFPPPRRAVALFRSLAHKSDSGRYSKKPMRYRLFEPEPIEPGAKYPLIVWLHGHGDEELKLEAGELKYIDLIFDCPGQRERYPFYVLAPVPGRSRMVRQGRLELGRNTRWKDG